MCIRDSLNIDQLLFYKGNADDKLIDSFDRNMREYYNYTLNNKYDGVTIIARFNYGNDNYKFASIKWEG